MARSAEKIKLMANSANGSHREIRIKCQKLVIVTSFIYADNSKPELISKIAKATAALTRLKLIWRDKMVNTVSCEIFRQTRYVLCHLFGKNIIFIYCRSIFNEIKPCKALIATYQFSLFTYIEAGQVQNTTIR